MRQYTIQRLMIAIVVIGVALALLREYPFFTVVAYFILALFGLAWSVVHVSPNLASRLFIPSALWLNLSLFVSFAYSPLFHKSALFIVSLIFIPIVPALGLVWVAARTGRYARVRAASIVAAVMALSASMLATHWPLRLAFYLSSPALNRLADRVESGEALTTPEWAGLYLIHRVSPFNAGGDLMLRVNPTRGQMAGFIRRKGSAKGAKREALYYGLDWGDRWNYHDSW